MSLLEWLIARANAGVEQGSAKKAQRSLAEILAEQARARVVSERDGKFRVVVIESSDPQRRGANYLLDRREVEFDTVEVGLEGKLILRNDGFCVSYHLIPNDSPDQSSIGS